MAATFVDYYATLGCKADVTRDKLDTTMLALVKKYQTASDEKDVADFLRIKEAYTTIKDPKARAKYDKIYKAQMELPDPTGEIDKLQEMVSDLNEDGGERGEKDEAELAEELEKMEAEKENAVLNDAEDRHELLLKFYNRRRENMKEPGIGAGGLAAEVGYPKRVLEFHLWYFRERGWIERMESGQFSITAAGVDKIEMRIDATKG